MMTTATRIIMRLVQVQVCEVTLAHRRHNVPAVTLADQLRLIQLLVGAFDGEIVDL